MSNLRIFGIIIGLLTILFTFFKYRGSKWKKSNFLFQTSFGLVLSIICINPNVVNFARDMLSLQEYMYGRFLALLIISNIFLFFLTIYVKSKQSTSLLQLDKLIRSFAASDITKKPDYQRKIKPIMVLIPAYNEAENLRVLLPEIPDSIDGMDLGVLVIDDGSDDELLTQAVEIIRETHRASTSSLQRRLRIGYTRAARLIDILEERGIVGPPCGSGPREILIDLDTNLSDTNGDILEEPIEEEKITEREV